MTRMISAAWRVLCVLIDPETGRSRWAQKYTADEHGVRATGWH